MSQTVEPGGRSNAAAEWGTACHQLCERCLRDNRQAVEFLGTEEEIGPAISISVDDEMVECAQEYLDYVRKAAETAKFLLIEKYFSLDSLDPPFDAGGTTDALLYYPDLKMLEVVDLKTGKGILVDPKNNPQLRTYALGAMLAHEHLDVQKIQVTIVQTRAPHSDGRIRSEIFHVADLIEWTGELVAAMHRAAQALADIDKGPYAQWAELHLHPGDHCTFCPAAAVCPALAKKAMADAKAWFQEDGSVAVPNSPDKLMPEDIAKILDAADMIQDWLNAVRGYAHAQVEMGVAIPGYQLVDKRAMRKWTADEQTVREKLFLLADMTDEQMYERKLRSVAQVEKVIGAKRAAKILAGLWSQESSGTNLVRSDKTERPPAKPAAQRFFEPIGA